MKREEGNEKRKGVAIVVNAGGDARGSSGTKAGVEDSPPANARAHTKFQ